MALSTIIFDGASVERSFNSFVDSSVFASLKASAKNESSLASASTAAVSLCASELVDSVGVLNLSINPQLVNRTKKIIVKRRVLSVIYLN